MEMKEAYEYLDDFFKNYLELSYEVLSNDDKCVRFLTICNTEDFGEEEILIEVGLLSNDTVVIKFIFTNVKDENNIYKRINDYNASNQNILFKCYLHDQYLIFEHDEHYCTNFDIVGSILDTVFEDFAEERNVNLIKDIFKEEKKEMLS